MPWKECDTVSLRRELVELALAEGANVAALCRRFGVSRKTAYKWKARYQASGVIGLRDRSRRPHRYRCRTAAALEAAALAIRDAHPAWGGRKIRARLQSRGHRQVPAASTLTAILHRQGRIRREESLKRQELTRFEYPRPNDLWQMDFKGEFKMVNGRWCYPLTVLDDHSRYSLGLRACADQRGRTVRPELTGVFRRYGLPWAMLMDHGTPWSVSHTPGAWTKLSAWLLRLDVRVIRGRPYHPQTQGKEERFHRTLKAELLQWRSMNTLAHAQRLFDPWRRTYNFERPHEALKMATPASRYRVSLRAYPEKLPPLEYGRSDAVRSVNPVGQFHFQGRHCKTSEAFGGERIAMRPTATDGLWDVYYAFHRIGQLDLRTAGGRSRIARVLPASSEPSGLSSRGQDP
ncbi:MAG TPA: IS481 family transposase [Planctomycetota bacterium]|nr:IS481 family transposase [Planctomycetota bacterium]